MFWHWLSGRQCENSYFGGAQSPNDKVRILGSLFQGQQRFVEHGPLMHVAPFSILDFRSKIFTVLSIKHYNYPNKWILKQQTNK